VRTHLGVLAVRGGRTGLAPGSRVRLVVRPEAVRLSPGEPHEGSTALTGKIVGLAYTGAVVRYWVEVLGTRLAVDVHDPAHSPQYAEGDRVSVQLPADPPVLPVTATT
jgi:ABC-type Fe3+/spermidine/putrescine transport system ATPase subunit